MSNQAWSRFQYPLLCENVIFLSFFPFPSHSIFVHLISFFHFLFLLSLPLFPFQHSKNPSWVAYKWYKYIDQPAFQHLGLSSNERNYMQGRIENLHKAYPAGASTPHVCYLNLISFLLFFTLDVKQLDFLWLLIIFEINFFYCLFLTNSLFFS